MEEDTVNLENERSVRIRQLLEQQGHEIEMFDAESLKMGFSTVVITNFGDQVITVFLLVFLGGLHESNNLS